MDGENLCQEINCYKITVAVKLLEVSSAQLTYILSFCFLEFYRTRRTCVSSTAVGVENFRSELEWKGDDEI